MSVAGPGEALQASVDDAGVHLPAPAAVSLSVELDGRNVWSMVPARDGGQATPGDWLVRWPEPLRPFLDGRSRVVVRSVTSGDVVFEDEVWFGDGTGEIRVLDNQGRPLGVNKSGRLTVMFTDAADDVKETLVLEAARALELLRDNGHSAFLGFGCLLGAVRDGRLIGHDNDADVVYLARATHPVDIMIESMAIEREFVDAGWRTVRMSGADFKVIARLPGGRNIGIDVFAAFYLDGLLHVMPGPSGHLPVEALLPTSTVELEGRKLPAPARPEALLELTYGPDWRAPDPAFKYQTPRRVQRRIRGLFQGARRNLRYWQTVHGTQSVRDSEAPSPFARWFADREPVGGVLDVGCGAGGDALWLAEQGFDVLGLDYSGKGLALGARRAAERGVGVDFRRLNAFNVRQMLTLGALLPRERRVDAVYARALVELLGDHGRTNLWRFCRSVLRNRSGSIYLEFRTEPAPPTVAGRLQVVGSDLVADELRGYGFVIKHLDADCRVPDHDGGTAAGCRIVARLETGR